MELATAAVAKVEAESALLMQSESAVVRHAASKGDYVAGQLVGWPVLGLRPGTRHLFRVNGKNVLGYPKFSEESLIYPTRRK